MKIYCALLGAATSLAVAAGQTPPIFPDVWSADEFITLPNGQKGTIKSYTDVPNQINAEYSNSSTCDITITNWKENGGDGKAYCVQVDGSGKRTCQGWCAPSVPVVCDAADSLCSYDYKKHTKYQGDATINGEVTELLKWGENLGPIPMNELYLYVKKGAAVPVYMVRDVHPFGKEEGNITSTFSNFQALKSIPSTIFDIGADPSYACASPTPSSGCNSATKDHELNRYAMIGDRRKQA